MATTTQPTKAPRTAGVIREYQLWLPRWVKALPEWVRVGAALLFLIAASTAIHAAYVNGQFWMDEAITVGISSHSLTAIPSILRVDGSPPLFYLLLHIWMSWVGNGQAATHWLSMIFAAATIPAGYWAGRCLANKRAALISATFFAFNAFLDYYSLETRMYSLTVLIGIFATVALVRGFVYRERRYVIVFAISEALMLYSHNWALFFGAAAFLVMVIIYFIGGEEVRPHFIFDVIATFAGAAILFAPWVPNFIYQVGHTAAPWDLEPGFGAPIQIAKNVFGGASISVIMVMATVIGYSRLFSRPRKMTRDAQVAITLVALPVLTLLIAWLGSHVITPAWDVRYFAPIVAAMILVLAIGTARAGVLGAIAVIFVIAFMARPSAFEPAYKSDMQDIGGEMGPLLHKGDLVLVGQPEQTPLAYYYLPGGLKYANTMGPVTDPSYMNWVNAMARYRDENVHRTLTTMLDGLKPGQQLLYIRPLTEGEQNWIAPWTKEIRLRSAQYGAIIAQWAHAGKLVEEAWAPHNYRGSCCIANSAVLYKRT